MKQIDTAETCLLLAVLALEAYAFIVICCFL